MTKLSMKKKNKKQTENVKRKTLKFKALKILVLNNINYIIVKII